MKKELKVNPEELLKDVSKTLESFNQRLMLLEMKGQQAIAPISNKQEFTFNCVLSHFHIPEEQQKEFTNKLADLMKKYKVFGVGANLVRRF